VLVTTKDETKIGDVVLARGTVRTDVNLGSGYSYKVLVEEATLQKTRLLFSKQDLSAAVADMDMDAYDRKIVNDYSQADGKLKTIPAQRKKLEAVLHHVVKAFEPGKRYTEKDVNEILSRFHQDTATLRRELVGFKMMQREGGGGEYWRTE
jgi:hypothetical protein